jgi:4'-phosphopantetheinyl transferase
MLITNVVQNIPVRDPGFRSGRCLGERHVLTWLLEPDHVPRRAFRLLLGVLDEPERAKALAFRFDQHRDLYIVAHALLRAMLSALTGIKPSAWRFVVNAYGRPELSPGICEVPLRFNLSHTDGLAVCTVALRRDVGVDVEVVDRWNFDDLLFEDVFSAEERTNLLGKAGRDRQQYFYYLWTLKEAFAKALGKGLSLPFDRIAFALNPIRLRADDELSACSADWQFRLYAPTSRHCLALAAHDESAQDLEFTIVHLPVDEFTRLLTCGAGD